VPHDERLVTLGVDTHADIHVAVTLDHLGGMLGAIEILTTRAGYIACSDSSRSNASEPRPSSDTH
jgi:hypothetical protein